MISPERAAVHRDCDERRRLLEPCSRSARASRSRRRASSNCAPLAELERRAVRVVGEHDRRDVAAIVGRDAAGRGTRIAEPSARMRGARRRAATPSGTRSGAPAAPRRDARAPPRCARRRPRVRATRPTQRSSTRSSTDDRVVRRQHHRGHRAQRARETEVREQLVLVVHAGARVDDKRGSRFRRSGRCSGRAVETPTPRLSSTGFQAVSNEEQSVNSVTLADISDSTPLGARMAQPSMSTIPRDHRGRSSSAGSFVGTPRKVAPHTDTLHTDRLRGKLGWKAVGSMRRTPMEPHVSPVRKSRDASSGGRSRHRVDSRRGAFSRSRCTLDRARERHHRERDHDHRERNR